MNHVHVYKSFASFGKHVKLRKSCFSFMKLILTVKNIDRHYKCVVKGYKKVLSQ